MSGELGKASLDLTADTTGLDEGKVAIDRIESSLDALAEIARITEDALGNVKMGAAQSAESRVTAQGILDGVRGISDEARTAALELDNVKLSASQAAETDIVGDAIDRKLKEITRNANEARRATESVGLTGAGGAVFDETAGRFRGEGGRFVAGGGSGGSSGGSGDGHRNPGEGIGPFGSGYGRIGLLGTAIGAGVLTVPAAGPAIAGLLATLPTLAAAGVGALGTLGLAFDGVTKAIEGNKQAFDKLGPSAQQFVLTIRSLSGWFDKLRETAGASLFPGLTAGLKSALSPGTVAAITKAVQEFGTAIGEAGAMWGKYFGSPEFQSIVGPLMQAGAHNFTIIAGAALSCFDALGVLGRAAIPLTTWISKGIADGARLVDNWLHAKDASGQLAGAMNEAETSLRLVGGLIVSIGKAFYALGAALYPVAKVAVKDLTDGFNALAGWISRNQTVIREIVGGALKDLVASLKAAGDVLKAFYGVLKDVFGANRAGIIAGIVAIGAAIALALGPQALAITGAILAVGEIIRHWSAIETWFTGFGKFLESVFEGAWTGIKGIFDLGVYAVLVQFKLLIAGLKDGLGWIPGLGGKIKSALNDVEGYIESFRTNGLKDLSAAGNQMGSAWGNAFTKTTGTATTTSWSAVQAGWSTDGLKNIAAGGTAMGTAWGSAFTTATGASISVAIAQVNAFKATAPFLPASYTIPGLKDPFTTPTTTLGGGTKATKGKPKPLNTALPTKLQDAIDAAQAGHGDLDKANAAAYAYYEGLLKKHPTDKSAIYSAETPYAPPGTGGSVFTTPPPFTTGLGPKPKKPPVIPPAASHAEQLASRNAAKARALGNTGETAKRYLDQELADLTTATKLLKTKYESATGAARTQLFAALTTVRNKITTVRTELKKTITSDRAAELQFAVDQAKDAVASATKGTAAYNKAVTAEEAALRAQIKYLDARAKNSKLSLAARTKAINEETADKKALTALLKPLTTATGNANEAQFLSDYAAIIQADAPNANPVGGSGATDTHLYEIKHELRQQTPLLKKGLQRASFPATSYAAGTAGAVSG